MSEGDGGRKPYDRQGKDGYYAEKVIYYATLYPRLREVAAQHGYALALHGSLQKDLDVLAVPWVEDASPVQELVEALVERCGGFLTGPPYERAKPHGRAAWSIMLGGCVGGYVDLSVMPLRELPKPEEPGKLSDEKDG